MSDSMHKRGAYCFAVAAVFGWHTEFIDEQEGVAKFTRRKHDVLTVRFVDGDPEEFRDSLVATFKECDLHESIAETVVVHKVFV